MWPMRSFARQATGVSTGLRVAVAAAAGVVAAGITLLVGPASYAAPIGWDVAALTLLVWLWAVVWPMDAEQTAAHALRDDPTRPVSDPLLILASVISLVAVASLLVQAASTKGTTQDVLAGLSVATVALSWFVVHTVFMLRYAMLYYRGHPGGIEFNQAAQPRYSDFAYVAFTLGMTFQVSDTDLKTPAIRATALRQALLSYLFGAVILATMINLIASLASSG